MIEGIEVVIRRVGIIVKRVQITVEGRMKVIGVVVKGVMKGVETAIEGGKMEVMEEGLLRIPGLGLANSMAEYDGYSSIS